jgi:Glucose-6-phosphate dehydrogenase subunit C-terminal domain/Glucose-6-phosphate dehydrogenase subunit N-terminal domain
VSGPAKVSDVLARIESELRAIWAPDEQGLSKPHATTLNLVAVHGQKDGAEFLDSVDDVAARTSARTFVLSVDPRLEPWALDGEVSAVCRLEPGSGREAVCAERVFLRFGAIAAKRAGSVIEALTESSLPSALVVGPGAHASIVDALAPSASTVVIDSRELGVRRAREIAASTRGRMEDLSFIRIRRWREMAARFFDDPEVRPALGSVVSVKVQHTPRPDHAGGCAAAEMLVAWLGSRLGWRAEGNALCDAGGTAIALDVSAADRQGTGPGRLLSLEIRAKLGSGDVVGRAERAGEGEHLAWELAAPCAHPAAHRYATPRRDEAELIERAIHNVSGDKLVRDTLDFAKQWGAAA